MSRISARLERGQFEAAFSDWYRFAEQRMEQAALIAVDTGRKQALGRIRQAGSSAGLGRLFNGLGSKADEAVHRNGNGGFSASGVVFIRSGSERTRGAIDAYTRGADIRPMRGRWLWITSNDLPRVTGRFRMTPELYIRNGFEKKIGPLVFTRASDGTALLIVRNVGVSAAGRGRSARSLKRNGAPRKGQARQEFVVAFIGIPRTARAARVDVAAIMQSVAADLPALFYNALGRI